MDAPLIRRVEGEFAGAGARNLFERVWLPPAAERCVVLTHGYAEHSGRYEHVGTWLAERGCAVRSFDHQGHGRSDGPRGHAASLDALLDDLDVAVRRAAAEHPGLPIHVLGHSMGGLVALAYAVFRRPAITGVLSTGAALAVAEPPPLPARIALQLLRRVLPRLRMPRPVADEALSRDPEVGRRYRADPLVFQTMTVSLGAAIFDGGARTLDAAGRLEVPALLLHGEDDPLVPAEGSRRFFAAIDVPGSELEVYPELRHEILNEPEWEMVASRLLGWMRDRESAGVR